MKLLQFRVFHLLLLMLVVGIVVAVYPYYAGRRTAIVKVRVFEIDGDPERRYPNEIRIVAEFLAPEFVEASPAEKGSAGHLSMRILQSSAGGTPEAVVVEREKRVFEPGVDVTIVGIPRSLFESGFSNGDEIRFEYQHFKNRYRDAENPTLILLRKLVRDTDPDESIKAEKVIEWIMEGSYDF